MFTFPPFLAGSESTTVAVSGMMAQVLNRDLLVRWSPSPPTTQVLLPPKIQFSGIVFRMLNKKAEFPRNVEDGMAVKTEGG